MDRRRGWHRRSLPVTAVAASLLVMAAGMAVVGVDGVQSASHLRSSPMPGIPELAGTHLFDATATASAITALALMAFAVATVWSPSWFVSMLSAFVSIPVALTGISVGLDGFRLPIAQVGPLGVPIVLDAVVLVLAATVCFAGSVWMWRVLPRGPRMVHPPMTPPTHQG